MDSVLKGLFGGGDDDHTSQARDFVSRFEQGPIDQGYSDEEAMQNYQRVAQHADPATLQRAAEQTFARMDPNQRAQFAQMLQQQAGGQVANGGSTDPRQLAGMVSQVHQSNPGGLASLFGGGGSGDKEGGLSGVLGSVLGGGNGGGGGGFPGGTLGKVALGGIAAYAMKEMLGGHDDDKKQKRSV